MNTTKYLMGLLVVAGMTAMTSCKADEGTEPGHDSNPAVTLYQYAPSLPYNSDNDVIVRFATNNATADVYYLVEKAAEAEAAIKANEAAYIEKVVSAGKKVEGINGESNVEVTITGLSGPYLITAVATNGNARSRRVGTYFTGLEWEHVVDGIYTPNPPAAIPTLPTSMVTELQICTSDSLLYRLKDVYGEGYSMKFTLMENSQKDADGEAFELVRVYSTPTPYTFGQHGAFSVRDIATWQGAASWASNSNYWCGMYPSDHYCFFHLQYYVPAGNIGYNQGANMAVFIANQE